MLKLLCFASVAFAVTLGFPEATRHYTGHSVLRVVPQNQLEVKIIKKILAEDKFDVWQSSELPHHPVDVRVAPSDRDSLRARLLREGLRPTVFIPDLQEILNEDKDEKRHKRATKATYLGLDLNQYHSYNEMQAWLRKLANDCTTCSLQDLPTRTHENRVMSVLKISSGSSSKRSIFIDCGIHAREWVAPATCLTIIHKLVTRADSETATLLNHFDFYVLPVANPDGYEYSRNSDRMWRKNRRPGVWRGCEGTDLNRNFDFYWGVTGTSTDPCSDLYGGPNGFSEPESQNIRDFVSSIKSTTDMYLTFHSYGQLWLNSWGYTRNDAPDASDIEDVGEVATRRIRSTSRTRYQYGSAAQVLYASAGGSDDWAKGGAGIKYSYTIELRDTGRYGFALPARLIQPTAEEAWEGTKAAALEVMRLHPTGTK